MLKFENEMRVNWKFASIVLVFFEALVGAADLKIQLVPGTGQVAVEAKELDQIRVGSLMFSGDLNNWFPAASTDQPTLNYNEQFISGQR